MTTNEKYHDEGTRVWLTLDQWAVLSNTLREAIREPTPLAGILQGGSFKGSTLPSVARSLSKTSDGKTDHRLWDPIKGKRSASLEIATGGKKSCPRPDFPTPAAGK